MPTTPSPPGTDQQPPDADEPRRPAPFTATAWIMFAVAAVLLAFYLLRGWLDSHKEIGLSDFERLAEAGEVKKVTFVGKERVRGEVRTPDSELIQRLELELGEDGKFSAQLPPADSVEPYRQMLREGDRKAFEQFKKDNEQLSDEEARKKRPAVQFKAEPQQEGVLWPLMIVILPTILLLGLFFFVILPRLRDSAGGGFVNSYGKSPAKRYDRERAKPVTFTDVAGMENVKSELQELVDFLKSPEKFQRLGAQVPKGSLLIGPPGTGKTLLARAVAGEAGVPFFSVSGSEFIQMFVGVGASRVRDLFKTAKDNAPCLIFIDEIDAVGRMRGAGVGGGSDEREQTLNQILSEMDGFQPTETVIVIAATNRPDVLDSALLRPGRFDRHITVDRPTWQGRLAILKVHTRNKPLAEDVDLELIARKMIGMTGADLRNLANEAALLATRADQNRINRADFERAADRVLIGPKREEVLSEDDRRRTANHEAGHAITAWVEPAAGKPLKVSIVPRGRALGVNMGMGDEDRYHYGEDYFWGQLVTLMGGRAADRLAYKQAFAGHENDLKQATRLARMMVARFGMSDRVGPMALRIGEEHVFLGKEIQEARDFSEGTAQAVDEEVQRLLREADGRAFHILEEHREDLDRLVAALLEQEELNRDQIDELLKLAGAQSNGTPARPVFAPEKD